MANLGANSSELMAGIDGFAKKYSLKRAIKFDPDTLGIIIREINALSENIEITNDGFTQTH